MIRHADDHREAARAFERLLDDPRLREKMGSAGRTRAVEEFSYDGLARRLGLSLGALT
jgi:glycosyltransferase involved in cell wall biosynthesis